MKLSKMSSSISPSLTRKLFNMANEIGDDVINLTLGDPDVLPPSEIREAACNAIKQGKTRYSANAGLADLRKSYASFFERHYGIATNPVENIIATVGGMEALYLALACTVDPGDEVIILGPYYVNYYQMISLFGGRPVVVDGLYKSDDEIAADIRGAISDRTVGIIINSPSNPTGDIISGDLLDEIARVAEENELLVISDEVYSSLVYDGNELESIITRKGMLERTVLVDSCSKRFAMTGWRIGVAVGPRDIIANMTKMQENIAACAPLASQYGAIKGYAEDFDYSYIKDIYQRRRDLVYDGISAIPSLSCRKPKATFYCFADISRTGLNSEEFAYSLLEKKHVAVVPGIAYGEQYSDHIRIAFTLKEELLAEAMERIKAFCEELDR